MKQKAVFIIFKGLSVVKNCLRPESTTLKNSPYLPDGSSLHKARALSYFRQIHC